MKFIDKILASKKKKIYVGLKSATQSEIKEYKHQLKMQSIKYMHLTNNLPYNGILVIER